MNTQKAAEDMFLSVRSSLKPTRDHEGKSAGHALWMLRGIILGYVQHEKAHRWLGYAQGILVLQGLVTLRAAKEINVKA